MCHNIGSVAAIVCIGGKRQAITLQRVRATVVTVEKQ
jgi:hypothetical protein